MKLTTVLVFEADDIVLTEITPGLDFDDPQGFAAQIGQTPSPKFRRVGFRIALFEACSTFIPITAYIFAESPT